MGFMQRTFINAKTFARSLCSYLAISMCFFTLFTLTYTEALRRIKNEKIEETASVMRQGKDTIDDQFFRTFSQLDVLAEHEYIKILGSLSDTVESKDYFTLLKAKEAMADMAIRNEVVMDCMLLFEADIPFMLSPSYITADFRKHYDLNLFTYGTLTYDKFIAMIHSNASSKYSLNSFMNAASVYAPNIGSRESIVFVKKLAVANAKYDIYAIVLLDAQKINELILPIDDQNSSFSIINQYGENLLGGIPEGFINDVDFSENGFSVFENKGTTKIAVSSQKTALI